MCPSSATHVGGVKIIVKVQRRAGEGSASTGSESESEYIVSDILSLRVRLYF